MRGGGSRSLANTGVAALPQGVAAVGSACSCKHAKHVSTAVVHARMCAAAGAAGAAVAPSCCFISV